MNMASEGRPFLDLLDTMLDDRGKGMLYPCVRDLVEHGLDLTRFAAGGAAPQRQDITRYLAAWSRHAGLSESASSDWLIDYCVRLLAPLSRRTPAAIRHSTKSNLLANVKRLADPRPIPRPLVVFAVVPPVKVTETPPSAS
jgi:hypothetical protein